MKYYQLSPAFISEIRFAIIGVTIDTNAFRR